MRSGVKVGGYRVVYSIQTQTRITLLTIYTKSDQNDISLEDIKEIIANLPDDE
jgi:uncharacterized protein YeeX (DUF496 family)